MRLKSVVSSLLLAFIIVFFTGCTSTPKPTKVVSQSTTSSITYNNNVPDDGTYIYLFRESEFHGSLSSWPVIFEGKKIGDLTNETYILVKTNPGKKHISPESNLGIFAGSTEVFELDAKAGESYYLRNGIPSAFTSQVIFTQVANSRAEKLIPTYKHLSTYNDYKSTKVKQQCKYWSPKTGITDEDTESVISDATNGTSKELTSVNIKGRSIPVDKILTTINIIKKVDNGDFKGAAQDVSSEMISYMLPMAGQYKALLDATKTAIDSVIANWVEDLYTIQSYNWVRNRVNKEVLRGAKKRNPFYPTPLLKRSSPLYAKMFKIERAMYLEWLASREYFKLGQN